MSFTLLSFVMVLVFVTVACIEIYRGIKRGFILSLVTLGNIFVSLLLSFAVTPFFSDALASTLLRWVKGLSAYQNVAQKLYSLDSLVLALSEMLLNSMLFVGVFLIARILLSWPLSIAYRWSTVRLNDDSGYGREDNSCSSRLNKKRGAICGAVSAFLITMVVTCPIMGTLELADRTLSIVGNASNKVITSIGAENVQTVKDFSKDITGNVFYRTGGRWIYSNAASTKMQGKRVYLLSELETVEKMSGDMLKIYSIFQKPQNATFEHVEALDHMRGYLQDLTMCDQLIGDVLRQCSTSWKDGKSFFGVKRPAMNVMVEPAFVSILDSCSNTTLYTAKMNADTLLEVYGIILDSGVFGMDTNDYTKVLSLLAEHQTIEKVERALEKNPNMESIEASSIMMSAFSSYIGSRNLSDDQYNSFMRSVASAVSTVNASSSGISHSRKVREFSEYAQQYFSEIGIEVPSNVTEMLASELLTSLTGSSVTAEDVKFMFEKYKNR
ncbi:MAG: hypothetical protein IJA86_09750 [Clostridia bacterium]|nr:hypothetical protein [Clostridia bacterium]